MVTEKMSLQEKKRKLRKLRSLLNTAWNISNDLIGEEEHSHTKNGNHLYNIRTGVGSCKSRLAFVEYKD